MAVDEPICRLTIIMAFLRTCMHVAGGSCARGDAKQASLQLAAGREWPLYVTNMLSFSLLSYTESKHNSIMAHMKVKGVICRHGAPQELLSDRGAN